MHSFYSYTLNNKVAPRSSTLFKIGPPFTNSTWYNRLWKKCNDNGTRNDIGNDIRNDIGGDIGNDINGNDIRNGIGNDIRNDIGNDIGNAIGGDSKNVEGATRFDNEFSSDDRMNGGINGGIRSGDVVSGRGVEGVDGVEGARRFEFPGADLRDGVNNDRMAAGSVMSGKGVEGVEGARVFDNDFSNLRGVISAGSRLNKVERGVFAENEFSSANLRGVISVGSVNNNYSANLRDGINNGADSHKNEFSPANQDRKEYSQTNLRDNKEFSTANLRDDLNNGDDNAFSREFSSVRNGRSGVKFSGDLSDKSKNDRFGGNVFSEEFHNDNGREFPNDANRGVTSGTGNEFSRGDFPTDNTTGEPLEFSSGNDGLRGDRAHFSGDITGAILNDENNGGNDIRSGEDDIRSGNVKTALKYSSAAGIATREFSDGSQFTSAAQAILNNGQFSEEFSSDSAGTEVLPILSARIDRGFEIGDNGTWIGYKRNYFTLVASFNFRDLYLDDFLNSNFYTLNDEDVNIDANRIPISYFALRIVAKCSDDSVNISLMQQTPKRDKGPQFSPPVFPAIPGELLDHETIRISCNKRNGSKVENMSKLFFLNKEDFLKENPSLKNSILHNYPDDSITKVARFERIQFTSLTRVKSSLSNSNFFTLSVELLGITENDALLLHPILLSSIETPPLIIRGRSPSKYHREKTSGYRGS